jgi:hypothetical protein
MLRSRWVVMSSFAMVLAGCGLALDFDPPDPPPGHDAGADLGGSDLGGHDLGGRDLGAPDFGGHDLGASDLGGEDDLGTVDLGSPFDLGVDAGVDLGVDAGVDLGVDAGVDLGVDAGSTTIDVDAGPSPCGAACAVGSECCPTDRLCHLASCLGCCRPIGPTLCGGVVCPRGEYCATTTDACDATTGVCAPVPASCLAIEVCGCDGNTYGDACAAAAAGVSVRNSGPCAV